MFRAILLLLLGCSVIQAQSEWWIFTSKGRVKIQTLGNLRPNTVEQFSQWVDGGIYTGARWQIGRKSGPWT